MQNDIFQLFIINFFEEFDITFNANSVWIDYCIEHTAKYLRILFCFFIYIKSRKASILLYTNSYKYFKENFFFILSSSFQKDIASQPEYELHGCYLSIKQIISNLD